ncbi:hypothetical protein BU14_1049s0001 [Porphyra umbilicalis]|uniref:Photosystem II Psb27 protein n=1 Tax=Porphyra umbilicalis TaxID=2786 RepID=A0A1X6NML9_PORUM|nr:hypothetical protein BU14_1049s0001 [Porphyra umbilicalis]|eukprot:OSX69871.1 hypothetical protein BU14_1049s0001 [Porphyra umbilicalis]
MAFVGAPLGGVAARTPLTSSRSAVTARPAGVTMAAAPLSRRGLLGLAAAAAAAVAVPSVFAEETAVIDAPAVTEAASSAASAVSSAASAVADAPAKAVEAVKTAAPDSPAKAVEAVKAAAPDAPAPLVATNFTVTGDYVPDAKLMLNNLKAATALARGTPGMADTVNKTRKQMNDFVALYRRNGKVSGSVSFSTLYTAINTLSGHYASYGAAYPVPEKRKKRLNQQFSEIDRAIARGR